MRRVIIIIILIVVSKNALSANFDQWISDVQVITDCSTDNVQSKNWSNDIEEYSSSDYYQSMKKWMPLAKSGNPQMQFYVAKAYFNGDGVEEDLEQSVYWYKKSSSQEYSVAQNNLALLYENGLGVDKDISKAFSIMCKSARAGLYVSQFNMGRYYQFGVSINRDGEKAKKWYEKAIENGHVGSAYNLAVMYFEGDVLDKNIAMAVKLIKDDAEKLYPPAMFDMGNIYHQGIAKKVDLDKSLSWYKKACNYNYSESCNQLGRMYQDGVGVGKNHSLALSFYKKAADMGLLIADNNIGAMYLNGIGVEKDYDEAFRRFSIASNGNIALATRNLGVLYQNGFGVEVDHNKAKKLFTKAANKGDVLSMFNLAYIYDYGVGEDVNKINAFYWYQQAAENGHKMSQVEVGTRYNDGVGVKQDYQKARYWYEQSIEHADALSLYHLAEIYNYGKGIDADLEKAEEFYKMSGEKGFSLAQFDLGELYSSVGMKDEAVKWYEMSGESGYWPAQRLLGDAYSALEESDLGVVEDFKRAEYWYLKAVEEGDVESIASLGWIYVLEHDGLGRKRELFDPEKGVRLLNEALEKGSVRTYSYLSYVYEFGVGVDRDIEKSINFSVNGYKGDGNPSGREIKDRLVNIFETHLNNQLYEEDLINAILPFLIDSAESGSIDHQILLGKAYLSSKFPYHDEDEGLFWLNKAAETSIEANEQLVLNHFGFDGLNFELNLVLGSIDRALELYESEEAVDIKYYRNQGLFQIIDLYHRGAELNLGYGKKEVAESMLRRASSIHLKDQSIRYTNERKIILALFLAKNGDTEPAIKILNSVIKQNSIMGSDYFTLSNHVKATQRLASILYENSERRGAVDLLVSLIKQLDESHADISLKIVWRKMLYLVISEYYGLMNEVNLASYYLTQYQNIKQSGYRVDDLLELMEMMSKAIIYARNGDYDSSYELVHSLMLSAKSRDIPVTEDQNLVVGEISSIMAENKRPDLAFKITDQYLDLYHDHSEDIVSNGGRIGFTQKNKIKNLVSNYIYYSQQVVDSDVERSFESMQLASGLSVSDSLVQSLMRSSINNKESVIRKKIEDLLTDRRNLLSKKYNNYQNIDLTLDINDKLNKTDKKIQAYRDNLSKVSDPGAVLSEYIVSASTIQKIISSNDALITMLVSDDRTYIWLVTKNGVYRHKSPLILSDINRIANELKDALDPNNAATSSFIFPFNSSNLLFDEIVRPFNMHLSNIDRLLIVPDPALSNIPLTILTNDADHHITKSSIDFPEKHTIRGIGTIHSNNTYILYSNDSNWIVNQYAISTIPSVYSLTAYNNVKHATRPSNFFGIGNPVLHGDSMTLSASDINKHLDTRDASTAYSLTTLSALPDTKNELEEIASYFGSSLILSDYNATEKKLRATSLRDYDVISFATHALVANEISGIVEPSLVLTPSNYDVPDDDGLLTMSEVSKLDIDADIVLLSACNTASSYRSSSSEGLSGLANSFFQAGAKSLLVSYWSVISESAVDLTTRMFKPSNDGRSYAHKHQNAVLDLLSNSKDASKLHPSYWAPFSIIGVY